MFLFTLKLHCVTGVSANLTTSLFTLDFYRKVLTLSSHTHTTPCTAHTTIYAGFKWFGVDIMREDIADNFEACVWEPAMVKINALTGATEAAALILSVDETIKNPKSGASEPPQALPGMGRGRGRGRPM